MRNAVSLGRGSALFAVAALIAGSLAGTPAAAQPPPDCPPVMAPAELQRGMLGHGLTVEQGRQIDRFDVEVLGVLPDGIGPGRDLIIIDTSGPMIDRARGIWFGMSGSPIYVGDKLIGALAFGLSAGPSSIAGVTPAGDMLDLLSYPAERDDTRSARRVALPDGMKRTIARHSGTSADTVGSLVTLRLPLSVSGLGARLRHVNAAIEKENLPFLAHTGSSASLEPEQAPGAPLEPGSSFAAVLSYGDITAAGVGTTTIVCGGKILAFGHPFAFQGSTTLGANAADAIAIVDDPLFGPYKLATIEEGVGTVDQDRFAGIRSTIGGLPPTIPLGAAVTSLETGRSRSGETRAVISDVVPFLAFLNTLLNLDMTFDQIGEGSSGLSWTIRGTRSDGSSWELNRSNLFASEFDITLFSVIELEQHLFSLLHNDFEDIAFTSVDVTAAVDDEVRLYAISDVLVSTNGVDYADVRRVRARPRQLIRLRVVLEPHDGSAERTVDLSVRVPRNPRPEGYIEISGAQQSFFFEECFFGESCAPPGGSKIESFDDLIATLESSPKNNELRARLRGLGKGVATSDSELLDQVVNGFEIIRVRVASACCRRAGDGGTVSEPKPEG